MSIGNICLDKSQLLGYTILYQIPSIAIVIQGEYLRTRDFR
jgi:hypothetical protein